MPETPRCWKCGYDLTGLRVDELCPECGTNIWSRPTEYKPSDHADMAFWWGLGSIFTSCLIGPFAMFLALAALRHAKHAELEVRQGRVEPQSIAGAKSGRIMAWCSIVLAIGYLALFVAQLIVAFL